METKIGNPDNLILMAMVFVTAGLAAMVAWNRRRSLQKLASSNLLPNLLPQGSSAPWLATGLLCGSFFFLTLSLLDLRWGKVEHEIPQKGIEVVFALDVSRSMLAEDAAPNRLERAKQQIKDLMDEMVGDRVGLVAFAGEAKTVIPLTSHYDDFKSTLDGVGPHSIRVGGSRLGTAFDVAEKDFLSQTNNHKAIVVLTDGEDQESDPVGIATRLFQEQGIRIFTIGLGDWEQGAKIPVETDTRRRDRQGYLTFQGDTVWSKQDGETLKAIALATSGAYIPAGTKFVDMAQVYQTYIAPIEKTEFETATVQSYEARYQWFAVPAILCLLGEVLWRTTTQHNQRDRSPGRRHENNSQPKTKTSRKSASGNSASASANKSASALAKMLILFLFIWHSGYSAAAIAQESHRTAMPLEKTETIRLATQKINAGAYQDALTLLEKVTPSGNQIDLIQYNQGLAQHGLGDLPAAIESFRNAAASNNRQLASQSRYNLGNCLVESAEATEPQQAMAGLNQAIQVYRDALRLNPNYSDARANIETAYQKLQQLKTQQQNQDQQKDQNQDQSPQQENQSQENQSNDASQKSSDSQNSESENQEQSEQEQSEQKSVQQPNRSENQNSDSKERNDQNNKSQQDSTGADNAEENSDGKENAKNGNAEENKNQSNDNPQDRMKDEQREPSDNKDPNKQQNSNQDESEKQDRQSESQSNNQTEPQQPDQQGQADQGQADQGQTKPDQQSGKADSQTNNPNQQSDDLASPDSDSQVNDSQNSTNDTADNADDKTKPQDGQLSSANQPFDNSSTEGTTGQTRAAMTLQEAKKMLQAIRDRDFQRRAELQRRERMQHVPVERDW